jgi:hypothetical protein
MVYIDVDAPKETADRVTNPINNWVQMMMKAQNIPEERVARTPALAGATISLEALRNAALAAKKENNVSDTIPDWDGDFTFEATGESVGAEDAGSNPIFVRMWWKDDTIVRIGVRHNDSPGFAVHTVAKWKQDVMTNQVLPATPASGGSLDAGWPKGTYPAGNAGTSGATFTITGLNAAAQKAISAKEQYDYLSTLDVTHTSKGEGTGYRDASGATNNNANGGIVVTLYWHQLEPGIIKAAVITEHHESLDAVDSNGNGVAAGDRASGVLRQWPERVVENNAIPEDVNGDFLIQKWEQVHSTNRATKTVNGLNEAGRAAIQMYDDGDVVPISRQQAIDTAIAVRKAELQSDWEYAQTEALIHALNTAAQEAINKNQALIAAKQ